MRNSSELNIVELFKAEGDIWQKAIKVYNNSFPEWEKEDDDIIADRLNSGRYIMKAALSGKIVIGFYILDIDKYNKYALFSFMAVDQAARGKGYGTFLCKDAINYFKKKTQIDWFMIEAEDLQAKLYGILGFKKITVEYQVPKFNGDGSVAMHLMVFPRKVGVTSIGGELLSKIIRKMFISGYLLKESDPRFKYQLEQIHTENNIAKWPLE